MLKQPFPVDATVPRTDVVAEARFQMYPTGAIDLVDALVYGQHPSLNQHQQEVMKQIDRWLKLTHDKQLAPRGGASSVVLSCLTR